MPTTARKRTPRTSPAYIDEYVALCADLPLVKIESRTELAAAERVIDRLALVGDDRMSRAQSDYLDVLIDLHEEAEGKFFGPELAALEAKVRAITGVELLRHLADANGLSGGDVGRVLGSRQLGNAILRGDRQISKASAVKLAAHFGLDAGAFL